MLNDNLLYVKTMVVFNRLYKIEKNTLQQQYYTKPQKC